MFAVFGWILLVVLAIIFFNIIALLLPIIIMAAVGFTIAFVVYLCVLALITYRKRDEDDPT